jgi:hypothetical protein
MLLLLNWLKLRKRKIGCKTYSSRTYKESNSFFVFFFNFEYVFGIFLSCFEQKHVL